MQNIIQVISVVTFIFLGIATFIDLEKLKKFPEMMQGIGMALLAILIPFAIAILSNYYQKKEDTAKDFAFLDLHVILDEIFKFKWLLVYFALIFLPTMFWETFSSSGSHFIAIILSLTGVYFVVKTLLDIYRWVKGNPSEFRFSYLEDLKNHEDMEAVWRSVWQAENTPDEREYCKTFSSTIDRLLKTDGKLEITSKLLNDFRHFIDKRSIFSLLEEIYPKALEWYSETWPVYQNKREKLEERSNYSKICSILRSIIVSTTKRTLKCDWDSSKVSAFDLAPLFFEGLKKHSEVHKNERQYLKYLFNIFYRVFFEDIKSSLLCCGIWGDYLPPEWKVTKGNLKDENNFISRISLNEFVEWAKWRIWNPEGEFDKKLEDVFHTLFPEVEPIRWYRILIFHFSPHDPNNRVKSVIKHRLNFNLTKRANTVSKSKWIKNTFELATLLFKEFKDKEFKDTFSKENLEGYIKELNGLEEEYKNDPSKEAKEKEGKRLELLRIFNEWQSPLK